MNLDTPCCNENCRIVSANSMVCSETTECAESVMCKYPCYLCNLIHIERGVVHLCVIICHETENLQFCELSSWSCFV